MLLDGIWGGAGNLGHLGIGEVVEVEEQEFLLVIRQEVDEFVEFHPSRVGDIGKAVEKALINGVSPLPFSSASFAQFYTRCVEGDAIDPGGGIAFATELRPSIPEVSNDFLIEVIDVGRLAVGESKAYSIQDAA